MNYLNSYRPLIINKQGRAAVEKFGIPAFVDTSCRREPDFESMYPSITAVCRGSLFVPRLHPGDKVIYITVKRDYMRTGSKHWRLVAALKVIERFESHDDAARWYQDRGLSLPSNCFVSGNPPMPYDKTSGPIPKNQFGDPTNTLRVLRKWDGAYKDRVKKCGVFIVCEPEYIDLNHPPILTENDMLNIFGKIPANRNPPRISEVEYDTLLRLAGSKN